MVLRSIFHTNNEWKTRGICDSDPKTVMKNKYTCAYCKEPLKFNVPRLGLSGGLIHQDGQILCISELPSAVVRTAELYANKEVTKIPNNEKDNWQNDTTGFVHAALFTKDRRHNKPLFRVGASAKGYLAKTGNRRRVHQIHCLKHEIQKQDG